jgi:C-terminal processing protease CtpA/Prc
MVVLASAYREDSDIVRGTTILSINGKKPREIVESMGRFISTDGWNDNFKYQIISSSFPIQYKNTFGLAEHYDIGYLKQDGSVATKQLLNYNPKADTIDKRRFDTLKYFKPQKRIKPKRWSQLRSLSFDTANSLAIMKLNTFSNAALTSFFRKSFRTIRQRNIQNLAIELRENGGGAISNSNLLTRFIINRPFRDADTVAGIGKNFPYPEYVQNHFFNSFFRIFFTHKKADGRNHVGTLERRVFKPINKNHFDGHVYIITGGFTFSASTLFIHPLQGQKNVTVVGEETGGGAYGNNAVNIPDITLPNTGLRVRLPLYRMVLDSTAKHNGRGILPDVYVPPSSKFIREGKDPKMVKVVEMVTAGKINYE